MAHPCSPNQSEFACSSCGAEWSTHAGNNKLKLNGKSPCCSAVLKYVMGARGLRRMHLNKPK